MRIPHKFRRALLLLLATVAAAAQTRPPSVRPPVKAAPSGSLKSKSKALASTPHFKDVAQNVGLTASHTTSSDMRYIIESMSGGVGLFDCDGDGRLDVVMVNGSTVERYRKGGDPMVTLWHQEADQTFNDISREAGLARRGWGMGVAVTDYDNDGNLDLFVTGYGGNVLYRNLGHCRFEDVTEKAGVRGGGFSTGAAWADYDRDGNVDLFVARYVHVDIDNLPEVGSSQYCYYKGLPVQCGPRGLPGEGDLLYHNRGDGTFEEVSQKAGVADAKRYYGMGVMWSDYDNDGWPDLFVANDATPSYLYHNNHDGTFTDVAMASGVALSSEGEQQGRMGVDFGDFDHSGQLSLFETNFADQPNGLFHNLGDKGFEDISFRAKLAESSYPYIGWGAGWFDMDNSGWLDLFVANGHVYPQLQETINGAKYPQKVNEKFRQPMLLHRNNHDGTFAEVSKEAGLANEPVYSRRGAAFGDVFNTGNIDIVVLNLGEPPSLFRNMNHSGNHRVLLKLVGTTSNRAAIGARVTIHAARVTQIAEVHGGGSYLSQNDLRLHFGLGSSKMLDSVEVLWPSGKLEKLENVSGDKIYTIVEGAGIRDSQPLPAP